MPLINRFTRLFTADLNAVLDRIEEPDILLRQSVRDMETELSAMRGQLSALRNAQQGTGERERTERALIASLDDELDMCFAAGEQALARNLVKRKLETGQRLARLLEAGGRAARQAEQLEASIAGATRQLDGMREKLRVLLDDDTQDSFAPHCDPAPTAVTPEELEIAWLREKQRRAGA